ncbi:nuclease [Halobacteriovorax vibrionivorans]|uniref:Nuclease n=2 Tax=Halobacteriovoraceae TaxID=1652132 RepID=A0ABY0IHY7_9BACT|nr:nuclease [Halobacteriovorax vibrionivorans]TGD47766.1 nuclease [Halobacteriovorax sp. Y22]
MMKFTIAVATLLFALTTNATELNNYYPKETELHLSMKSNNSEALKEHLFDVLNSMHQETNGRDLLGCDSNKRGKCYRQRSLGYKGARKVLFGKLHLQEDNNGYFIEDVYCQKKLRRRQTRSMGPGQIPNSNVLNCEHTWPQSKFSRRFSKGLQKSDLHHLYPTDSRANSVRGNYEFDNVDGFPVDYENCTASQTQGNGAFEPPAKHKGNVARALFYFSVRYDIQISSHQEQVLREWDKQDPIDAEELKRNETIFRVQNNRNPFIDIPNLADRISDF